MQPPPDSPKADAAPTSDDAATSPEGGDPQALREQAGELRREAEALEAKAASLEPSPSDDLRRDRFTYAGFTTGLTGFSMPMSLIAIPFGVSVGHVWWDRGMGVEGSLQSVFPLMYGSTAELEPSFPLWTRVNGRFGRTWGDHWLHGVVPVGVDLQFYSHSERGTLVEAWFTMGGGLGYARRFARRGYFGLDLTAFASVTPNGVESSGSVSVVNRTSYAGEPPPARRYVAFRGGGELKLTIGGWF